MKIWPGFGTLRTIFSQRPQRLVKELPRSYNRICAPVENSGNLRRPGRLVRAREDRDRAGDDCPARFFIVST